MASHVISSKAANKLWQKGRHGNKVLSIKYIYIYIYKKLLDIKTTIKQAYLSLKYMFIPMHVLLQLLHYITTPMTLMHVHVNAYSWCQSKEKKRNPNLVC